VRPQGTTLIVWVTFTSRQDAGKGPAARPQETCTDWSLDYAMAPKNSLWLIDATRPHAGTGNAPCASRATGTTSTAGATETTGATSPPS
jgi:hypothetical protein